MSVQRFDDGVKNYTAAFKFVNRKDPKEFFVRYYGVWAVTKNPNQYIKTTLNWQHRNEDELVKGTASYRRSPNDACYPVYRGYKITEAWVAVIEVGTETVDNSMITV